MASSETPPDGIGRLDHIGIVVADLAAAKRFVGDVLGLHFSHEVDLDAQMLRAAFFSTGSVMIELIDVRDPVARNERLGNTQARIEHIAWQTGDLTAAAAALELHGVRVRGGIDADAPDTPLEIGASLNLWTVPSTSEGMLMQLVERRPL